jgi:branched-chain amino acid aminotransferase
MKVYIDGKFYDKDEAKISVYDHGLLYGDGVFEGIRVYKGRVFRREAHIERLFASAQAIMLDIGMTQKEMIAAVEATVQESGMDDAYIRLVVTRGRGDLGINPATCKKSTVIIIVDTISLYPKEYYEKGIAVVTASVRRIAPDQFDTRIKSLNYLNNILAKLEAQQAGCMEAVILNKEGYVAECTADNIFVIKKGVLCVPPAYGSNLEGITRGTVIDAAKRISLPCFERTLTQYDLYTADECFITGTGAEIMPVTKIDGRVIGSGAIGNATQKLRGEFWRIVAE